MYLVFLWEIFYKLILDLVFRLGLGDRIVSQSAKGCPFGVMVKAMDCGIGVSEFELQSCYYVHFQTNILGKG